MITRILVAVVVAAFVWGDAAGAAFGREGRRPDQNERRDGCAGLSKPKKARRGDVAAEIRFLAMQPRRQKHEHHQFDVSRIRAIIVQVDWKNLPESGGAQRLELYTPDGDLYRAFVAPVTNDTPAEVVFSLQGWVTDHHLLGRWCAEVFLVGESEPVEREAFVLKSR